MSDEPLEVRGERSAFWLDEQESVHDLVKNLPRFLLLPGLNHATALAISVPELPEEGPTEIVKTAVVAVREDDAETVVIEFQPSVSVLARLLEKLMGAHKGDQAVQFFQNLLNFHKELRKFFFELQFL